jgi:hypothetical protein
VSRISILFVVGVCVLTGAAWFWQSGSQGPTVFTDNSDSVVGDTASVAAEVSGTTPSPFALENASSDSDATLLDSNNAADLLAESAASLVIQGSQAGSQIAYALDVTTLGRSSMSDEDFLTLAKVLRGNPELLQQLIDEFRQETDADRRIALSRILGEVGGDGVTLTASELIYSGDGVSRRLGLELLQQIQPGNAAARDIASTLLATEVEPTILVDTLTTLAKPGAVDDNSRQFLSEQVAFLTDHEDASVRSISLDILSRWSNDGQYTEVLRNGLLDQESVVRESAAYALVGHENVSQNLIASLLAVAVDSSEVKSTRSGAILALKGMPIDSATRQQVTVAEREVNQIRR